MMELFTLGAGRGYSQHDVHAQARALTGFTNDWSDSPGPYNFHFDRDAARHRASSASSVTAGASTTLDSCRLCVEHPLHPSFAVGKLWGYFIAEPPPAHELRALERTYVRSGFEVRPLVEAILRHPLFYDGARMVIPPAVYCAGMLRALGSTITTDSWSWIAEQTGQRLFDPPNVAGWDYAHWLDTSRWSGRFTAVNYALQGTTLDTSKTKYPAHEDPGAGGRRGARALGRPAAVAPPARENLHGLQPPGPARDQGRLGAGHLPDPAPERAPRPDSHDAGMADLLMARARPATAATASPARRRSAARCPAAGRPRRASGIPGCPSPPGPGSTAAASCSGAAGGLVSVYGAGRLGLGGPHVRRGGRQGGGGAAVLEPGARVGVPAGRDRQPLAAGPDRGSAVPKAAPDAGGGAGRRRPLHRGPAAELAPVRGAAWPPCTTPARSPCSRASATPSPDMSHFTSRHYWEVGATDARLATGWLGRYLDAAGSPDNPLQGLSMDGAMNPTLATMTQPGGRDRQARGLLAVAGGGMGRRVRLDARRGIPAGRPSAPLARSRRSRRWPRRPPRSGSSARRWRRSATRPATPRTRAPSPTRRPRQRLPAAPGRPGGDARRRAAAAVRGADHRHPVRHPLGAAARRSTRAWRRWRSRSPPSRPTSRRAGSPTGCCCTCGRSSAAAPSRTGPTGPTTAPPAPRC